MANYIKGRLKERHAPSDGTCNCTGSHAIQAVYCLERQKHGEMERWRDGEMEKRLPEPFASNSPQNCEAVVSQSAARSVPDIIVKSFEDLYTQHPDLFEVSASNLNLILSPPSLPF